MRRLSRERERLERAKTRLDRLDFYPRPVSIAGVRVLVVPLLFRVPGMRRYRGYALWRTIVVRSDDASENLLTHELCHVWQAQHRPFAQFVAWLRYRYRENPFEQEAQRAGDRTS